MLFDIYRMIGQINRWQLLHAEECNRAWGNSNKCLQKTDSKIQVDIQIILPYVLFITIYFNNIYNIISSMIIQDVEVIRGKEEWLFSTHVLCYIFYIINLLYHKCLYKIRIQCAYLNNVSFSLDYFYDCHNWYPNNAENNHTPA